MCVVRTRAYAKMHHATRHAPHTHALTFTQVFWRSLGFRGHAEVIDLWTGQHLGTHKDHWPSSYSDPLLWGLAPHAHRLVKVLPARDAEWVGGEEEARAWLCPKWGCSIHNVVRQQWRARVK